MTKSMLESFLIYQTLTVQNDADLKDTKSFIITFMKDKKKLLFKTAFPSTPKSDHLEPVITSGVAHQKIAKDLIYMAFMT